MAVPRSRTSYSKQKSRAAGKGLKPKNSAKCSNCGALKMPHRICPSCGFYANNQIITKKDESKEK